MNRLALLIVAVALLSSCYESHWPATRVLVDAGMDADAPPDASVPPLGDCPAPLQVSAPSAVAGYCPTGTNRSAFAMPSSQPELRWELDVPADRNVRMAVGPGGRVYLTAGEELIAIDDRGASASIAWSVAIGERVPSPMLLADGSIFVTAHDAGERECVWVTPSGEIERRVGMPTGLQGGAVVDRAGHFVFVSTDEDERRLVALDAECGELWRSQPFNVGYDTAHLSPNGQLIVTDNVRLDDESEPFVMGLDPDTGERVFRTSLGRGAYIQGGPAVDDDGAIYVVLWTDASTVLTFVVLEPTGEERLRVALPEPPWGGGVPNFSVASDGTAFVKEGRRLMAVSAAGEVLWELPTHPNIDAVATVDGSGLLLVGSGGGMGVDTRDGTIRWTSEIPAHRTMLPGGGVSIAFPGPATIGDGALYYMAADGVLQAASTAR